MNHRKIVEIFLNGGHFFLSLTAFGLPLNCNIQAEYVCVSVYIFAYTYYTV